LRPAAGEAASHGGEPCPDPQTVPGSTNAMLSHLQSVPRTACAATRPRAWARAWLNPPWRDGCARVSYRSR